MFIPFLKMSPIHHITLSPLRPPLPKPAAPLAGNTTSASSQLLLPLFSWSLGSLKGTFDCRTTPTLLLFPRVVSGNPLLTGQTQILKILTMPCSRVSFLSSFTPTFSTPLYLTYSAANVPDFFQFFENPKFTLF